MTGHKDIVKGLVFRARGPDARAADVDREYGGRLQAARHRQARLPEAGVLPSAAIAEIFCSLRYA